MNKAGWSPWLAVKPSHYGRSTLTELSLSVTPCEGSLERDVMVIISLFPRKQRRWDVVHTQKYLLRGILCGKRSLHVKQTLVHWLFIQPLQHTQKGHAEEYVGVGWDFPSRVGGEGLQ